MARRVGSASARNVASRRSETLLFIAIWFNNHMVILAGYRCQARDPGGRALPSSFDPPARSFGPQFVHLRLRFARNEERRLMEASPAAVGVYTPVACEQL